MDIKELEKQELRERIFKQMSEEFWDKAEEIYKKEVGFDSWGKFKKFFQTPLISNNYHMPKIKDIQMELLEKELNDTLRGN